MILIKNEILSLNLCVPSYCYKKNIVEKSCFSYIITSKIKEYLPIFTIHLKIATILGLKNVASL